MAIPKFTDIMSFSKFSNPTEISKAIIEAENNLFNLRFNRATRKNFKAHEIKYTKRRLAQLKTLLTLRLQKLEQKEENLITN